MNLRFGLAPSGNMVVLEDVIVLVTSDDGVDVPGDVDKVNIQIRFVSEISSPGEERADDSLQRRPADSVRGLSAFRGHAVHRRQGKK